ncbi:hypothetical protein [Lederbergia lenta]|uniref:hypothetical protein n=1 Tax=Lederbergia lenta TaxID=1467 RepID=UPI00203E8CDA|nr:hypothetical protein [Lederbergia lenta]MCM3109989.1 hypothetical protein [Lederbergia lenta]
MITNTYFGFTNNLKPMQAARIENTLDKLFRYDGKVMTEKEFILNKLIEGYTPQFEENYTYYSRKIDDYTKPKTLYMLKNSEGSYTETTKTAYNFALYLIENGLNNMDAALEFASEEKERLEAEVMEAERIKKQEEEERRLQREKEELEHKERHRRNVEKWRALGEKLTTNEIRNHITDSIENHWDEIEKSMTVHDNTVSDIISSFTEQLGNQAFITRNASYVYHDDVNKTNLSNKIYRSIYSAIFDIKEDDPRVTITAKVKAFYEGREYKGSTQKELETFFILKRDNGDVSFEERQGEKFTIAGTLCFISNNDGVWTVTEARTGLSVNADKSKQKAIQKARDGIQKNKERLERTIEQAIERNGMPPLYKKCITA